MNVQDINDMQTGIQEWSWYGLGDNSLGTP
jgi:hypothetical protein